MRVSTILVMLPVAVIASVLAVANREEVAFRLDPFAAGTGTALVMPLFLLVFASFVFGVLVGAATVALKRARTRRQRIDIAGAMARDARPTGQSGP